jgi:hypothetical protein
MKFFILIFLLLACNLNLLSQEREENNIEFKYRSIGNTIYKIALPYNYILLQKQESNFFIVLICNKDSVESSIYAGLYFGKYPDTNSHSKNDCILQFKSGQIINTDIEWKIQNCTGRLSIAQRLPIKQEEIYAFADNRSPEEISLLIKIFESLSIK